MNINKLGLTFAAAAMLMSVAVNASNFAEEADVGNVRFDVQKITSEWKADGVWSGGEYKEIVVQDSWRSAASGAAENLEATRDLQYVLGMSWDENYIYGYLNFVDANGHDQVNGANPGNMWQTSCLHIGASVEDAADTDSLKYGIAVTSDTNEQICVTWIDYLGSSYDAAKNGDFIVVNNDDNIVYEWRTPIEAFAGKTAAAGDVYAYCYSIGWGNDNSRQHTQIGAGLSGGPGEQAARFPRITLVEAAAPVEDEIEDTTAPVEDIAPGEDTAPVTADAGIIAAVASMITAFGYAFSKKK